jgi:hypothetical protein
VDAHEVSGLGAVQAVFDRGAPHFSPIRCEFVMMAAGIKPCCLIWSGVSEDNDNPQYTADFAKICLWMTTVRRLSMPRGFLC